MAYQYTNKKGQKYFLHSKDVRLRGSEIIQTIYFFARDVKNGSMEDMPMGFKVVENDRTGLPVLKKT